MSLIEGPELNNQEKMMQWLQYLHDQNLTALVLISKDAAGRVSLCFDSKLSPEHIISICDQLSDAYKKKFRGTDNSKISLT